MIDTGLKTILNRIKPQWKAAFISAFIIGILTHMYVMTNNLMTPDGTWNIYSDQDMIYLGRQFLMYACKISSYYNLPWLNGLLAIVYIALTAAVVVEAFDVKSVVISALVGGLMVTFPTVASTFCYVFTIDGYMLALLLSALAVLITDKFKKGWIAGIVLIGLSLGIYQAYYSFAILLCILILLMQILKNMDTKAILLKAAKYCGMGIGGYVFYVLTLKAMLALRHIEVTGYQGTDKLLGNPFVNIKEGILASIRTFASFGVKHNVLTTTPTMTVAYVITLIVGVALFIYMFIKNGAIKKWDKIVLAIVLIAFIPVGTSLAAVMEPKVFFHLLMRMPWALFFVFILKLVEDSSYENKFDKNTIIKRLVMVVTPIATAILIFEFAVAANTVYFTLNERYEKTYGLCLRIVDRLEETEGYKTGDHVALMGGYPDREYYPETCITWRDLSGYFDPNGEYVVSDSGKLSDFCYHYLNFTIVPATYEEHGIIANSKEYLEMPKFPDKDSVKEIDDIWVIKLNG
ncbi:Glucosyl transferase GtrII [Lachnospiraceae bacterium G11]|nr:Glucosyl transferase GtrII [Lachnospiraceae bacterium G11]